MSLPLSENPANRRRSDRVVLQISIIVRTKSPGHEPIQETTQTMVVNAHGGLMKLRAEVLVGQPMILVNPQNGMEQSCRVVRADPSPDFFAVAFEFDRPNPKFWPITFPPENWTAPTT